MCTVVVKIPDEVMYDTHMNSFEATALTRQMLALGLYTQRNVSIGYCANVAGLTEEEFILLAGKYGISIFGFEDEEELMRDVSNA